jgi:hypothetical protein
MPLHWSGRDVIAQRMADRIGHGMSERCNVFADVAIEFMTAVYNAGYQAGHEETVEGFFVPVSEDDKETYHRDLVEQFISELSA